MAAELRESQKEIKSLSNLVMPWEERKSLLLKAVEKGGGLSAKQMYGSPLTHTHIHIHHGKRQSGEGEGLRMQTGTSGQV